MENTNSQQQPVWSGLNFDWTTKLPIIYQSELAECGLACLAMIAGYYHHQTSLNVLRKKYSITLKGVTLSQIVDIAQKMGMSSRAIKVELEDLKMLRAPAILHWDMNHFVVLKKVTRTSVVIHDPARGVRTLKHEEISNHFSGVALELIPNSSFEKHNEKKLLTLSSFVNDIVGFKRSIAQIFILSLVLQAFGVMAPYYTQLVIDNVLVGHDRDFLVVLGIGTIVLTLLTTGVSLMRTWVSIYFNSLYSIQLSSSLLKHMLHLPINWFETRHIGDILSRFSSLKFVQSAVVDGILGGILNTLITATTIMVMLAYSIKLTLITVAGLMFYITLRILFYPRLKQATEESIVRAADETSCFVENVNYVSSIKLYARESVRHGHWLNKVTATLNTSITIHKLQMIFGVCQTSFSTIESVVMLWVGANMVMENQLTTGMLLAFLAWRAQFVGGIYGLVNGYFNYKMLDVHLDRVADIAIEETEKFYEGKPTALSIDKIKGSIELKNIHFRFGSHEPWIFRNYSLLVEAGQSVVISAPSGVGKTTLMKIMMGFIAAESGDVLLDGEDIKNIGLSNYRSIIGSVLQNDKLMAGTIEENITFFSETVDESWMRTCAKMANVSQEIEAMPLGYKSIIGEMGNMLSGGQQQRVLIARALYGKPKILFLDEATSHLDKKNEDIINENISKLAITRIQISHREDVQNNAQRVIFLPIFETQNTIHLT